MVQALPYRNLHFFQQDEIDREAILSTADNADTGYILECDIEYLKELHNQHNDYPLAAESMFINEAQLSDYTRFFSKSMWKRGIWFQT